MHNFRLAFRIKKRCAAHSIIYWLKKIPLLGRAFPYSLHNGKTSLKVFEIIYLVSSILIFLAKAFFLMLSGFLISSIGKESSAMTEGILPAILIASLAPVIMNILNRNNPNCFMMIDLFHENEQQYALRTFKIKQLTLLIYVIAFIVMGIGSFLEKESGVDVFGCIALCLTGFTFFFLYSLGSYFNLAFFKRKRKDFSKSKLSLLYMVIIGCLCVLSNRFFVTNSYTNIALIVLEVIIIGFGFIAFFKVIRFDEYANLHSLIYANYDIRDQYMSVMDKGFKKSISDVKSTPRIDKLKGIPYFEALFTRRHFKLIFLPTFINLIILVIIGLFASIVLYQFGGVIKNEKGEVITITDILKYIGPITVYWMLIMNRTSSITRTYFYNCDKEAVKK